MASKNTGRTHFKPGNKGGGRKPLPPDILAAKATKQEDFLRWVMEIMDLKISDLGEGKEQIALATNKMPIGKRAVAKWFLNADIRGIEYCHNRLWGKVTESLELLDKRDGQREYIKEVLKQITDEDLNHVIEQAGLDGIH